MQKRTRRAIYILGARRLVLASHTTCPPPHHPTTCHAPTTPPTSHHPTPHAAPATTPPRPPTAHTPAHHTDRTPHPTTTSSALPLPPAPGAGCRGLHRPPSILRETQTARKIGVQGTWACRRFSFIECKRNTNRPTKTHRSRATPGAENPTPNHHDCVLRLRSAR